MKVYNLVISNQNLDLFRMYNIEGNFEKIERYESTLYPEFNPPVLILQDDLDDTRYFYITEDTVSKLNVEDLNALSFDEYLKKYELQLDFEKAKKIKDYVAYINSQLETMADADKDAFIQSSAETLNKIYSATTLDELKGIIV